MVFGDTNRRQANGLQCVFWGVTATLLTALAGCGAVATGENTRGVQLYEKGDYYAAMDKFQRAMATSPDNADAYYNMASTLFRLGQANKNQAMLQQAESMYNQCLDHDPNHADCYRALAVLLVETGRKDRAVALLKNWAIRNPQSADARIELARLYDEFGDKKIAETQLQQALQIDQTNRRAWTALAALRESQGDYKQALANYQRAYSLNPQDPAVAARIAALNRSIGTTTNLDHGGTRTVDASMPTARY